MLKALFMRGGGGGGGGGGSPLLIQPLFHFCGETYSEMSSKSMKSL